MSSQQAGAGDPLTLMTLPQVTQHRKRGRESSYSVLDTNNARVAKFKLAICGLHGDILTFTNFILIPISKWGSCMSLCVRPKYNTTSDGAHYDVKCTDFVP